MVTDYRLKITTRNNRILQRIEDRGYKSVAQFCAAFGFNYTSFSDIVRMERPAKTTAGKWTVTVQNIADALSCNPDDLFTDRQAAGGVKSVQRNVSEATIISLSDATLETEALPSPERAFYQSEMVERLMAGLKPRDRQIIERLYLDGAPIQKVADEFGVGYNRIRKIENRALYKMRRASGAKFAEGHGQHIAVGWIDP